MEQPKVSIIVPLYNSENYINQAIESVINQTYTNLQVIIVNDGSTDSSPRIIDEYALKDKRIVTIHKINGGIGSAYKAAFEVMTGDYVLFVDSDDWLELNAVEHMVRLATENEADMVSFGIKAYDHNGQEVSLPTLKNIDLINITNEAILKTYFEVLKHPTLVRLYKRELFKDIIVFEQNIGIDELITPQLLTKCNRAVFTSKTLYSIRVRKESVSRSPYTDEKIIQTINVYRFLRNFMDKNAPKYAGLIKEKNFDVALSIYEYCLTNENLNNREIASLAREEFLEVYQQIKKHGFFRKKTIKLRLIAVFLIYFPDFYGNLKLFFKKRSISTI